MRAGTSIPDSVDDPSSPEPLAPSHSPQCDKVLALDRAVRCLERAREELAQCIWTESHAGIELWIAQIRTLRPVFRKRLIAYLDHYKDCAVCQAKTEDSPTTVVSLRNGKISWRCETYGFKSVDPQNA